MSGFGKVYVGFTSGFGKVYVGVTSGFGWESCRVMQDYGREMSGSRVSGYLHYWIYTHFYTLCKTARIYYNDFTQKVETTFSNYQTQNANRLSEEQRTLGCIVGNETREHVFCLLILVT